METGGLFIVLLPLKPVSFLFKKIGVAGDGLIASKLAPTMALRTLIYCRSEHARDEGRKLTEKSQGSTL